jgi:hypothetical protein
MHFPHGRVSGTICRVEFMRHSLATANLPVGQGRCLFRSGDAISSGAIQATCGAIDRQLALFDGPVEIVLSGGAAAELLPHLNATAHVVDNLVLDGISVIASES